MLGIVCIFSTEKFSKLEKVQIFEKENANNDLKIFFLDKIKEFFTINLSYINKNQTKFNQNVKALHLI